MTTARFVGPNRVPTDVPIRRDGTTYTVTIPAGLAIEMEKSGVNIKPGDWVLRIDDPLPVDFRVEFRVEV